MVPIDYKIGDATAPATTGPGIIAHVCNDIGGWGRGFVLAISQRWAAPEDEYLRWYDERSSNDFALGAMQLVPVAEELWVANMLAQHDIVPRNSILPIRYDALRAALEKLAGAALERHASVHMPRIGCGLAGGKWELVEPIIQETLSRRDIPVVVYDLPAKEAK